MILDILGSERTSGPRGLPMKKYPTRKEDVVAFRKFFIGSIEENPYASVVTRHPGSSPSDSLRKSIVYGVSEL